MSDAIKKAGIISLEQLYLLTLCKVIEADKMQTVLQDFDNGKGRLWLVREGTTIPQAHIVFQFEENAVRFGIETRDERKLVREVKYAEGIDQFLQDMQKFLRAGRLENKRAA